MSLTHQGLYKFDEFELNLDMRFLARGKERVHVGPKAFEVLACLVSNAGRVVTREELLAAAWPDSFVEEGALSQQIFTLRKCLADKADFIATAPGQGYRFVCEVRKIAANSAADDPVGWNVLVQETHERSHMVIEEPMQPIVATVASPDRWQRYAAITVFGVAAAVMSWWVSSRKHAPDDFQQLVLADLVNTTGDTAFDGTLKHALEMDLAQSPLVDVMSDRESADALKNIGLPGDAYITSAVARQMCERTNRQTLLQASISNVGGQYLLTLDATDCNTGKRIAAAKTETPDKAKVLAAVDLLADQVRAKLGETGKSIKSFDIPFQDAATPSLDALKAYSVGEFMLAQGKPYPDILKFFQRAVEIDPHFAQAYVEIGLTYYNLSEPLHAQQNLQKAFDLRNNVGAKEKLMIEAHYYVLGQGDVLAGIKAYQLWADTYTHDWKPWLEMANWYTQLGQYDQSIAAGRRAIQLDGAPVCYIVLARAYKNALRFAEAKATGADAIRRGKDTTALHWILYEIAFDERDVTALAHEDALLAARKNSLHDYFAAKMAAIDGKFSLAESLFRSEIANDRQEGLTEEADNIATEEAQMEKYVGYPDRARDTLNHLGKQVESDPDYVRERASLGDIAFAQRYLTQQDPSGIDFVYNYKPLLEALVAMGQHKPLAAIAALEIPTPYVVRGIEFHQLLGSAYLQTGQFQLAAQQYRAILDDPPFNAGRQLALLDLARVYARAGDKANARVEYQAFLTAWKDADPDLPVLKSAKSELASIP